MFLHPQDEELHIIDILIIQIRNRYLHGWSNVDIGQGDHNKALNQNCKDGYNIFEVLLRGSAHVKCY